MKYLISLSKITKIIYTIVLITVITCTFPLKAKSPLKKTGFLETNDSGLPILHLNGTHYENGFLHGSLMKARIIELIALWKNDLKKKYIMPADKFIKIFLDSTNYIPAIKKWSPNLLEEIKGIADGAKIDFNTVFAFQLIDEMWTTARMLDIPHHCTSLGINNYKKNGSSNYIAQNIDIPTFYHGYEILLDIKSKDSNSRKLVTTFAGYIGANGLNKHIGITCNSLMELKSSKDGLPVCCVVRSVLEKNSFKEAEIFIKEIKHASGQNYIIGSIERIASFECSSDLVTEYWPDKRQYYTYHANRALSNASYHPAFVKYVKSVFNTTPDAVKFGDARLELMKKRILKNKSIDLETIKNVLAEKPVHNNNTWLSTIMKFTNKYSELRILLGKPKSKKYIKLRLNNEI